MATTNKGWMMDNWPDEYDTAMAPFDINTDDPILQAELAEDKKLDD
jgi:hypothetical protein